MWHTVLGDSTNDRNRDYDSFEQLLFEYVEQQNLTNMNYYLAHTREYSESFEPVVTRL